MVYIFAIIILTQQFALNGAEGDETRLPLFNPQTAIPIGNAGFSQHPKFIVDHHGNRIKHFLNDPKGAAFAHDKELFSEHNMRGWWFGFTNPKLLRYARAKLAELKPDPALAAVPGRDITANGLYAQMLQDFIQASEASDAKQRKSLIKKGIITGTGALVLASIQYGVSFLPHP